MGFPYWGDGQPLLIPAVDTQGLDYWADGQPLPIIAVASVPVTGIFIFNISLPEAGDFTLPIASGGEDYAHDFTVDWGDESEVTHITSFDDAGAVHTYAGAGNYQITISGHCEYFDFNYMDFNQNFPPGRQFVTELVSFTGDMGFKVWNCGGCVNLTTVVPLGTMDFLVTASSMFQDCLLLTEVPADLFAGCPNILDFDSTFSNCQVLAVIPADLFRYNVLATSFRSTFGWCYNFPSTVPTDLFRYNILVTTFYEIFTFCPIDTIPEDIFKYNVLVTNFSYTFDHKEQLVSVPENLFRYNVLATNFHGTFAENYVLTTIPADLFKYNVLVTTFFRTFYASMSLENIPADLFRYNVLVETFMDTFYAGNVTTIPADLFRYNVLATDFTGTFWHCENIQLRDDIFYRDGEGGTRFLNQNVDFTECFLRDSFVGNQGIAPDLWNCDFGTGTPGKTDCFAGNGNNLTSLSNYNSIPQEWGGPVAPLSDCRSLTTCETITLFRPGDVRSFTRNSNLSLADPSAVISLTTCSGPQPHAGLFLMF